MQQMQGNAEVAASLYQGALRLAPHEATAYANLALLERGGGARARLEMALRLRPGGGESGGWWAALGASHWAQGQLGHASHATRRALALRPSTNPDPDPDPDPDH